MNIRETVREQCRRDEEIKEEVRKQCKDNPSPFPSPPIPNYELYPYQEWQ